MPNDQKPIKPNAARKQAPRKQNLDNKYAKKAGDGTMGFMLWSIAGTVLASCSSPIFSDVADLTGGGGGGDAQGGPGDDAVTNGRWANTMIYMVDENGVRVDQNGNRGSNADAVGYSDGAGSIILNDEYIALGTLGNGEQYMAGLEGGIEISTGRPGVSGEELLSLPYVSGEALIISPLTDLLARQLMDSTNAAEITAMGEDAFIQKVLNDIFGERPQFDAAGDAIVELDANGDRMEGEFVNPTPQVTLADVLEADNYNAFVNDDTVTRLVSLASNELGVSPGTGSVGDLMTLFGNARTSVESVADETMLETQLDDQLDSIKQVFDARDDTRTANSRPVAANPNGGDAIPMTEDQNFTVVRGNAETLFGFEDPFGNAGAAGADGARVDGEFEGLYIEAASMGGDVDVMFRNAEGNMVALASASEADRGVVASAPAMTTVGGVRFYYVSEANFGQLVLRPDPNFNTASITDEDSLPQIRFYVYDGEHATVDNGGSLNGVGTLKIAVVAANDAPTAITADTTTITYSGNTPPAGTLVATLSTTDVDAGDTHTYAITGGTHRTSFMIVDNELRFADQGAVNVSPGDDWSVRITSRDSNGATFTEGFTIMRGSLGVTPPGDNMNPVFSGGELLPEDLNPQTDNSISTAAPAGGWNVLVGGTLTQVAGRGLLLGMLTDGEQSASFQVVYPAGSTPLFAVGGTNNNQLYYIGGAIGDADAGASGTNILSHTITIRGLAGNGDTVEDYEYVTNVENDPADNLPVIDTSASDFASTITDVSGTATGNLRATDATNDDITWTRTLTGENYGDITFADATDATTTWTFTLSATGRAALSALGAGGTLTTTFDITARDDDGPDTETLTITLQGVNDAPTAITLDNLFASYAGANPTADVLIGTLSSVDVDSTTFTYDITAGENDFRIEGDQLYLLETAAPRAFGGMWDVSITSSDGTATFSEDFTIRRGGLGVTPTGQDTVFSNGELLPEEYNPEDDSGLVSGTLADVGLARVASRTWNVLVDGTPTQVTGRAGLRLGTLSDGQSTSFEVIYDSGDDYLFAVLNDNELYYIGGAIGDADASDTNVLSHTIMVRGLAANGNTEHTYVINVKDDPADNPPEIAGGPSVSVGTNSGTLMATDDTGQTIAWTSSGSTSYGDFSITDDDSHTTGWTFDPNEAVIHGALARNPNAVLTTIITITATDGDGNADTQILTITHDTTNIQLPASSGFSLTGPAAATANTLTLGGITFESTVEGASSAAGVPVITLRVVEGSNPPTAAVTGLGTGNIMITITAAVGTPWLDVQNTAFGNLASSGFNPSADFSFDGTPTGNIGSSDFGVHILTGGTGAPDTLQVGALLFTSILAGQGGLNDVPQVSVELRVGAAVSVTVTDSDSDGSNDTITIEAPADTPWSDILAAVNDDAAARVLAVASAHPDSLDNTGVLPSTSLFTVADQTIETQATSNELTLGGLSLTAETPGPVGTGVPGIETRLQIGAALGVAVSGTDTDATRIITITAPIGTSWADISDAINNHNVASGLVTAAVETAGSFGFADANYEVKPTPDVLHKDTVSPLIYTSKVLGDGDASTADNIPNIAIVVTRGEGASAVTGGNEEVDVRMGAGVEAMNDVVGTTYIDVTISPGGSGQTVWNNIADAIEADPEANVLVSIERQVRDDLPLGRFITGDGSDAGGILTGGSAGDEVKPSVPNTLSLGADDQLLLSAFNFGDSATSAIDDVPEIQIRLVSGDAEGIENYVILNAESVEITITIVAGTTTWGALRTLINDDPGIAEVRAPLSTYITAELPDAADAGSVITLDDTNFAPIDTDSKSTATLGVPTVSSGVETTYSEVLVLTAIEPGAHDFSATDGVPRIVINFVSNGGEDVLVTLPTNNDEVKEITISLPSSGQVSDLGTGDPRDLMWSDVETALNDNDDITGDGDTITGFLAVSLVGTDVPITSSHISALMSGNFTLTGGVGPIDPSAGASALHVPADATLTGGRDEAPYVPGDATLTGGSAPDVVPMELDGGVDAPGEVRNSGSAILPEEYDPQANTGLVSGSTDDLTRADSRTWNVLVGDTDTPVAGRAGLLLGTITTTDSSESFKVVYETNNSASHLFAVVQNQLYYIGGAIGDADMEHDVGNILTHILTVRGYDSSDAPVRDYTYVVHVENDPADNTDPSPEIAGGPAVSVSAGTNSGTLMASDASVGDTIAWTSSGNTQYGTFAFGDDDAYTTGWTFTPNQGAIDSATGDVATIITITAADRAGNTDTQTLTINHQGMSASLDAPEIVGGPTASVSAGTNSGTLMATDATVGDTIAWTSSGSTLYGTFAFGDDDAYTTGWTFTPNQGAINSASGDVATIITITATDGDGNTDTQILTINHQDTSTMPMPTEGFSLMGPVPVAANELTLGTMTLTSTIEGAAGELGVPEIEVVVRAPIPEDNQDDSTVEVDFEGIGTDEVIITIRAAAGELWSSVRSVLDTRLTESGYSAVVSIDGSGGDGSVAFGTYLLEGGEGAPDTLQVGPSNDNGNSPLLFTATQAGLGGVEGVPQVSVGLAVGGLDGQPPAIGVDTGNNIITITAPAGTSWDVIVAAVNGNSTASGLVIASVHPEFANANAGDPVAAVASSASIGANDELLLTANAAGTTGSEGVDAIEARLVIGGNVGDDPAVEVTGGPAPKFVLRHVEDDAGTLGFIEDDRLIFTSLEDQTVEITIIRDAGHTSAPMVSLSGLGTDASPAHITITLAPVVNTSSPQNDRLANEIASSYEAIRRGIETHTDPDDSINGPKASDFVSVAFPPSTSIDRMNGLYIGDTGLVSEEELVLDPADPTPHVITITAPEGTTWGAIESAITSDSEANSLVTASVPDTAHDTQAIEADDQVGIVAATEVATANTLVVMEDGANVLTLTAKRAGSSDSDDVPTINLAVSAFPSATNISVTDDDPTNITIAVGIPLDQSWMDIAGLINANADASEYVTASSTVTTMPTTAASAATITALSGTLSGGTGAPDMVTLRDSDGVAQIRLIANTGGGNIDENDAVPHITYNVIDDDGALLGRGITVDEVSIQGTAIITANVDLSLSTFTWAAIAASFASTANNDISDSGLNIQAELLTDGSDLVTEPFSVELVGSGGSSPAVLTGGADLGDTNHPLADGEFSADDATLTTQAAPDLGVFGANGELRISAVEGAPETINIVLQINNVGRDTPTAALGTPIIGVEEVSATERTITITVEEGENWETLADSINSHNDASDYITAKRVPGGHATIDTAENGDQTISIQTVTQRNGDSGDWMDSVSGEVILRLSPVQMGLIPEGGRSIGFEDSGVDNIAVMLDPLSSQANRLLRLDLPQNYMVPDSVNPNVFVPLTWQHVYDVLKDAVDTGVWRNVLDVEVVGDLTTPITGRGSTVRFGDNSRDAVGVDYAPIMPDTITIGENDELRITSKTPGASGTVQVPKISVSLTIGTLDITVTDAGTDTITIAITAPDTTTWEQLEHYINHGTTDTTDSSGTSDAAAHILAEIAVPAAEADTLVGTTTSTVTTANTAVIGANGELRLTADEAGAFSGTDVPRINFSLLLTGASGANPDIVVTGAGTANVDITVTLASNTDLTWAGLAGLINGNDVPDGIVTAEVVTPDGGDDPSAQTIEAGDETAAIATANTLSLMQTVNSALTEVFIFTAKGAGSGASEDVPTIVIGDVMMGTVHPQNGADYVGVTLDTTTVEGQVTINIVAYSLAVWGDVKTAVDAAIANDAMTRGLVETEVPTTSTNVISGDGEVTGEGVLSGGTGAPDAVTVIDGSSVEQIRLISNTGGGNLDSADDVPHITFELAVVDVNDLAIPQVDTTTTSGTAAIRFTYTSQILATLSWDDFVLAINTNADVNSLIRAERIGAATTAVEAFSVELASSSAVTLAGGTSMDFDDIGDATDGLVALEGGADIVGTNSLTLTGGSDAVPGPDQLDGGKIGEGAAHNSGSAILPEEYDPQSDSNALRSTTSVAWEVLVDGMDDPATVNSFGLLLGAIDDEVSERFEVVDLTPATTDDRLFAVRDNDQLYYIGGQTGDADMVDSDANILTHTITVRGFDADGDFVEDYEYTINVENDPADNPPEIDTIGADASDLAGTITDDPTMNAFTDSGDLRATHDSADMIAWSESRSGSNYGSIAFSSTTGGTTTWTFTLNAAGLAALRDLDAGDTPLTTTFQINAGVNSRLDTEPLTITLQGVNDTPSEVTLSSLVASYAGAGAISPGADVLIGTLGSVDADDPAGADTYTYAIPTTDTDGNRDFRIDGNELYLKANAEAQDFGGTWEVFITSEDDTRLTSDAEMFTITRGGLEVTPPGVGEDGVLSGGAGLLDAGVDPQTQFAALGLTERTWEVSVLDPAVALADQVVISPDMRDLGPLRFVAATPGLSAPLGDGIPRVSFQMERDSNLPANSPVSVTIRDVASNQDEPIIQVIHPLAIVASWRQVMTAINEHMGTDGGPRASEFIRVDVIPGREAELDDVIGDVGWSDQPRYLSGGTVGDVPGETPREGGTAGAGTPLIISTPDTVAIGAGGELEITSRIPGLSTNDKDGVPVVSVSLMIDSAPGSTLSVADSMPDADGNVEVTITATATTTWQQLENFINTGNIATTLGGSPESEYISAAVVVAAEAGSVIDTDDQFGTGIPAVGGTPDMLSIMEGEFTLTAVILGDSDADGAANTPEDTIPTVRFMSSFSGAQNSQPTLAVDTTVAGQVTINVVGGINTTWEQVVNLINTGRANSAVIDPTSPSAAAPYVTAATTNPDSAAIDTAVMPLSGGAGTPDSLTVEQNGAPVLNLIANKAGASATNDDLLTIKVEITVSTSGLTNQFIFIDEPTPATPDQITIRVITNDTNETWAGVETRINDHARASQLVTASSGQNVSVATEAGLGPQITGVLAGGVNATEGTGIPALVLEDGLGTPDVLTLADGDGTERLIFSSRIAGDNAEDAVPEIGVLLVVDDNATLNVQVSSGTEERVITVTAPTTGTTWGDIRDAVNTDPVAGELVSVVSVAGTDDAAEFVTGDETQETPATRDSVTLGGAITFTDNTADTETRELRVEIVELAEGATTVKDLNDADVTVTPGTPVLILDTSDTNFVTLFIHILHGGVSNWNDIGAGGLENLGAANLSPNYSDFFMHEIPGSAVGVPVAGRHILSGGTDAMVTPEMLTGGTNVQDLVLARPAADEEIDTVTTGELYGLLIGTLSDAAGSTRFEVLYNEDNEDEDEAAEQVFVVDANDQLYYIGENTGSFGEEYELTVRGYASDDSTQDYQYVVNLDDPTAEMPDPDPAPLFEIAGLPLRAGTAGDDNPLTGATSDAELIQGGDGSDTISTLGGDDVIIGGAGLLDTVTLGDPTVANDAQEGAETVVYRFESDSNIDGAWLATDGSDNILNFEIGEDKLVLVDVSDDTPITNLADFIADTDGRPMFQFVTADSNDDNGAGENILDVTQLRILFDIDVNGGTTFHASIITFADDDNRPIIDSTDTTGRTIHDHVTRIGTSTSVTYSLDDDAYDELAGIFGGDDFFKVGDASQLPNDLDIL